MPSHKLSVLVASVVGVVALGAYAYYANRTPAPLQGEAGKAVPGAGAAGKAAGGIAVTVETAPVATARLQEDVVAIGTLRSNESVVVGAGK
jgi:membrane fusion protein (multidrug efflux system)